MPGERLAICSECLCAFTSGGSGFFAKMGERVTPSHFSVGRSDKGRAMKSQLVKQQKSKNLLHDGGKADMAKLDKEKAKDTSAKYPTGLKDFILQQVNEYLVPKILLDVNSLLNELHTWGGYYLRHRSFDKEDYPYYESRGVRDIYWAIKDKLKAQKKTDWFNQFGMFGYAELLLKMEAVPVDRKKANGILVQYKS